MSLGSTAYIHLVDPQQSITLRIKGGVMPPFIQSKIETYLLSFMHIFFWFYFILNLIFNRDYITINNQGSSKNPWCYFFVILYPVTIWVLVAFLGFLCRKKVIFKHCSGVPIIIFKNINWIQSTKFPIIHLENHALLDHLYNCDPSWHNPVSLKTQIVLSLTLFFAW